MVKISKIQGEKKRNLIKTLVNEKIDKNWVRAVIIGEKGELYESLTKSQMFNLYIWDNLTEEKRKELINNINLVIEEDILVEKQPYGNYCFDLLDVAIELNKLSDGEINKEPFLIWMDRNFDNLSESEKTDHPVRKELASLIKRNFL